MKRHLTSRLGAVTLGDFLLVVFLVVLLATSACQLYRGNFVLGLGLLAIFLFLLDLFFGKPQLPYHD